MFKKLDFFLLDKIGKYFCALLIIYYFIWRFFLRERIPHELTFSFSYSYLLIAILITSIYWLVVYRFYYPIKPPKNPKNPIRLFLVKYILKVDAYFDVVYEKMYHVFTKSQTFLLIMLRISESFMRYSFKYPCQNLNILFTVVPRLIVAFTFFIDVVFFNYMHYFYYAVYLLLFPLTARIIVFCLTQWSIDWQKYVRIYVDVAVLKHTLRPNGLYENLIRYRWKYPELKETRFHSVTYYRIYDHYVLHVLLRLEDFKKLDEYKNVKKAKILTYILYACSWSYILFKILSNFLCFLVCLGSIGV